MGQNMIIRLRTEKDQAQLEKVNTENLFTNGSMLKSTEAIKKSDCVVVAELDGEIVSYIALTYGNTAMTQYDKLWKKKPEDIEGVYIEQIATLKDFQGKGIGSQLIDYVKQNCMRGYKNLFSHVGVINEGSFKLHGKKGFIPIGDFICDDFYGVKNYRSLLLECNNVKSKQDEKRLEVVK